jgi:YHS domain-containing protein
MGSVLVEIVVFFLLMRFILGMLRSFKSAFSSKVKTTWGPRPVPRSAPMQHRGEVERDPVCGMFVSTEVSEKLIVGANTYHFCSRECMSKYEKSAQNAAS